MSISDPSSRIRDAIRSRNPVLLRRAEQLIARASQLLPHTLSTFPSGTDHGPQHTITVEQIAMHVAWAHEEAAGATVKDIHTPELARAAGLPDNPGFDLLSIRPGGEKRAIEVKGRAGVGEVEVSANEWAKACNLRDGYWLYAVYDCGTPSPRLVRVQDPFGSLLAKSKGSVLIGAREIAEAATT